MSQHPHSPSGHLSHVPTSTLTLAVRTSAEIWFNPHELTILEELIKRLETSEIKLTSYQEALSHGILIYTEQV